MEAIAGGRGLADSVIRAMERKNPRLPHDFTDGKGILHCGVCRKPKSAFIDFSPERDGSGVKMVSVACDCVKKRRAAEEAKEEKARRDSMRERSGINRAFTFQSAEQSPEMDKCWKYAENWEKAKAENVGLLLWGDVGTGKTFAAHCICNALIDREKPVRSVVTSLSRVLNAGWDKSEITNRIRIAPLVVFDDLGAERESEYALENIFMLVDERYKAKKPLIVTTNLPLSEMRKTTDAKYKRIYDRILEICVPVRFAGASRREVIKQKKIQFARDVLGIGEGA